MGGITITDVKIVGMCSKCRKEGDEIMKDKHGRVYRNDELSCVGCAVGMQEDKTDKEIKGKRVKCIYCGEDIHIDKFAGMNKKGLFCNRTLCLIKVIRENEEELKIKERKE